MEWPFSLNTAGQIVGQAGGNQLPDWAFTEPCSRSTTSEGAASHTITTRLSELQKPDRGRKFVNVDRRPLDPPPVASLQFFDVLNSGTAQQQHVLRIPDDTSTAGLVCIVDLLPVLESQNVGSDAGPSTSEAIGSSGHQLLSSTSSTYPGPPGVEADSQLPDMLFLPDEFPSMSESWALSNVGQQSARSSSSATARQDAPWSIMESENPRRDLLVGGTSADANIVDWNGEQQTMFIFSDLAVKAEGNFRLHYRVVDIANVTDTQIGEVIASCYGSSFKVYSTRDFPGLAPSTELTRRLSMLGIPINSRSDEGRGRRRRPIPVDPSLQQERMYGFSSIPERD